MTQQAINNRELLDIIKYPIITDKTTQYLEDNKYCFAVVSNANKTKIKQAIEYVFKVKVIKINTLNSPPKTRKIGKFIGKIKNYKKAIVELDSQDKINLFQDN
uniref:ribosomal protein L23 n=1 Tax=Pterothamnion plumula TaxID=173462 RepID=UPI0020280C44|nr:ribosomal protein L23 [Pterothamnion plumula]UPO65116.1 ribosomal protein L23 [Pterothamnion plumula]